MTFDLFSICLMFDWEVHKKFDYKYLSIIISCAITDNRMVSRALPVR